MFTVGSAKLSTTQKFGDEKNISNVQSYFNKKSQEFQRTYDYKYVSHVLFLMPMFLVHKNPLNGEEDNITSAQRKKKKKKD